MLTDEERAELRASTERNTQHIKDHVAFLGQCSLDDLIMHREASIDLAKLYDGAREQAFHNQTALIDAIGRFVYGEKYDREVEKG
jgi:hypothetical protein